MMKEIRCRLLVIGAGPGGYVCAARAGELGIDTVIVEADRPGGTCLNIGCIPSKALIHAADEFAVLVEQSQGRSPLGIRAAQASIDLAETVAWKDAIVGRLNLGVSGLLKRSRVKMVHGRARFRDGKTVDVSTETGVQTIHAESIVIATGSQPVELPALPFGGIVVSSTEMLSLSEVPPRIVVVGAGYIGVELGTAFAKLGSKVTLVDVAQRILPQYDPDVTRPVAHRLAELGVELVLGATARGLSSNGAEIVVQTNADDSLRFPADRILVAVGRRPAIDGWGLEEIDLDMDGPFIRVDDRCRTSMRGIHAIGDVTGEPMLAHRAMAQGEVVAEVLAGRRRVFEPRAIPSICFTDPEIVSAGMSIDEARRSGGELRVGMVPFTANGRAMTLLGEQGFVRVIARADNHLVLGMQAVGRSVSELAAEFGMALEMGARLEDIAGTIHAHPTLGEAVQEAAARALAGA